MKTVVYVGIGGLYETNGMAAGGCILMTPPQPTIPYPPRAGARRSNERTTTMSKSKGAAMAKVTPKTPPGKMVAPTPGIGMKKASKPMKAGGKMAKAGK